MGEGIKERGMDMTLTKEDLQAISGLLTPMHECLERVDIRLDKVEGRLDQVDARLDQIDVRLDQMDARFDQMDARLDQIDVRLDQMDARFDQMDVRFDQMEGSLGQMDVRFDQMEGCLGQMNERFDKVDDKLELIIFRQNHMSSKQDDLGLDLKVVKRDIDREIHDLNDQMETVIVVMEANELLPKKKKSW